MPAHLSAGAIPQVLSDTPPRLSLRPSSPKRADLPLPPPPQEGRMVWHRSHDTTGPHVSACTRFPLFRLSVSPVSSSRVHTWTCTASTSVRLRTALRLHRSSGAATTLRTALGTRSNRSVSGAQLYQWDSPSPRTLSPSRELSQGHSWMRLVESPHRATTSDVRRRGKLWK